MKKYIQDKISQQHEFRVSGVDVQIKDQLPDDINSRQVIKSVFSIIPQKMTSGVRAIKIGQFDELEKRDLDALYKDEIIYLTNLQDSDEDMLDDIVHEIAHSVEEKYSSLIYSDDKIKAEFLSKRLELKRRLENNDFFIDPEKYKKVSYDYEFDMFLYEKVGYEFLESLTAGLFYSPYAATSLREYFANAFENLFIKEESYQVLRKISPKLFEKLITLLTLEEKENTNV